MKTKIVLTASVIITLFSHCRKENHPPRDQVYSADVANDWMQMQIRLTKNTTGYNSVVSNRSFGYAGIVMYESVWPGMQGASSLLPQIGGPSYTGKNAGRKYYWPASLNAAMAYITRHFFESTSTENLASVDSLEQAYRAKFSTESTSGEIANAEEYGVQTAMNIFNWSKTDGADQAYKHIVDSSYIPPSGPGFWTPTPPALAAPIFPHWGSNRSFIANIADQTQPGPPTPYSKEPSSDFYKMVNELYTVSQSLTHEDSIIAKFWGDLPSNLNVPAHATNILGQLLVTTKKDLYEAATAYALHGIACYDASISVFKTKYTYNLLRPISYIRNVMLIANWNSVLPTPPHPEYSAAHAVISAASASVLEMLFGNNYKFTDHTYDKTYGARTYSSFDAYAKEAGKSRLLAGIHYSPSISTGLVQGRKVGAMVVRLRLNVAMNRK